MIGNSSTSGSVGCVGVLKQWLVRALSVALRAGEATLSRRNLEHQAPSITQADKILSEASEGEMRLMDSNEAASRLREQLGLVPQMGSRQVADNTKQPAQAPARRTIRRPGQRSPARDAIGKPGVLHAANA